MARAVATPHQAVHVQAHLLHPARGEDLQELAAGGFLDRDLDRFLVVVTVEDLGLKLFSSFLDFVRGWSHRREDGAFHSVLVKNIFVFHQRLGEKLLVQVLDDFGDRFDQGFVAEGLGHLCLHQPDGDRAKLAHHALHVAAYIADLRELGRLDLDERRLGELGEPSGNFCLAHPGGADHQDVLGGDVVALRSGKLLAPVSVTQGHRHRPLGRMLPDDVLIELGDDLQGGEVFKRQVHALPAPPPCFDSVGMGGSF